MAKERKLNELRVFIASPSDVADARETARRAILRIDRLVARDLGFTLRPRGWEDVPAAMADRAQELINAEVDRSHAFVGILHRRFGSDTGLTESGTLEEYKRVVRRRNVETPQPEVMMYFRTPPQDALVNPDEQLSRVLAFKEDIGRKGVFHKEFVGNERLEEEIENALKEWLQNRASEQAAAEEDDRTSTGLQPADLSVLSGILAEELVSPNPEALERLVSAGLLNCTEPPTPTQSTDGFLRITRHLLNDRNSMALLESSYYRGMIDDNLGAIVAARFHFGSDQEFFDVLANLAKLSPSAAEYLLFGDTRLYDNLAAHARSFGGQRQVEAQKMSVQNVLHRALLCYAQDSVDNRVLDHIEDLVISGQLISIRVAAAHQKGRVFDAQSVIPLLRLKAGATILQGQMVSLPPSVSISSGLSLLHMGELDWAVSEFDKVIELEAAPPEAKAAALNNKALIQLQKGERASAIALLKTALELVPHLEEAKNNLALAIGTDESKDT